MKRVCLSLAALCSVLTLPLPVLAEEGSKGSLSQLDVTLYPGQLFWIAVCFPLFFIIVRQLILPSVEKTQGNRQKVLEADMASAKATGERTKQAIINYEKTITVAREKAQAIIDEIALKEEKSASAQRDAQQKELNARIKSAEEKIKSARDAALREVQDVVKDVANAVVLKLKNSA